MQCRVKSTALAAALLAGVGATLVLFICDPARVPIYPVCLFHQFTGLACPGCGSLRAAHALLHGRWQAALHFNLLLVLSLPLCTWFGVRFATGKIRGRESLSIHPCWLWLFAGGWAAFGILRNIPVSFFTAWAP